MKGAIATVMKKEFKRFFGDFRLVSSSLILPGLMVYIMYSFMGSAFLSFLSVEEGYILKAAFINMPQGLFSELGLDGVIEPHYESIESLEMLKESVKSQEYDALAVFPDNFGDIEAIVFPVKDVPNVEIFYNSLEAKSSAAYSIIVDALTMYEESRVNLFDINKAGEYNLATDDEIAGFTIAMMLPILLIMFLFTGSLAIATESIAGEKERGTISTLLVTPIKRSDLALGKIFSLALIALLCSLTTTLGSLMSLPKLMGAESDGAAIKITPAMYANLFLISLSTILVFISIMSIISAFAKSVKEAQAYGMPLMVVAVALGASGMFGPNSQNPVLYAIPVYNSVQSISAILAAKASALNISIAVASNTLFSALGVVALALMFSNEKIMFSK
ncbi:MAG: ABC transporter permease subunit [Eubacteriaceae bacterium]|jgi:sodium transport system permease protein|nr:ABC transporter permease subunit [Eubacteriaceae bacterium]